MAKHVIKEDQDATVTISGAGEDWVIAKAAIVKAAQVAVNVETTAVGSSLTLAGDLVADFKAVSVYAENFALTLEQTAEIRSRDGIIMFATGGTVTNNGLIEGVNGIKGGLTFEQNGTLSNVGKILGDSHYAVTAYGPELSAENDGLIKGKLGFALGFETDARITNGENGRIIGTDAAIGSQLLFVDDGVTAPDHITVVNRGLIKSADGYAVSVFNGSDRIVNNGRIDGMVSMAAGNDKYILQKDGFQDGLVRMGSGDDTLDLRKGTYSDRTEFSGQDDNDLYRVSSTGLNLKEEANGGIDRINASVSFTLGDNFENLTLVGSADLKGTGNGENNTLWGNKGNNVLIGKAGEDNLVGDAGNDRLIGGANLDYFYFNQSFGKDIIADFKDGEDLLIFSSVTGSDDVADLIANHAVQKGSDTVISFGADSVTLKGMSLDHLDISDFAFPI